jgi:hypothetical protein
MPIFRLAHRRDAAESLLAEYLIKERQRRAAHSKVIESTVALSNRFAEGHGSFADDHSTL